MRILLEIGLLIVALFAARTLLYYDAGIFMYLTTFIAITLTSYLIRIKYLKKNKKD